MVQILRSSVSMALVLCYAAVWVILWSVGADTPLALWLTAALAVPSIWLSLTDLDDFTIPDAATLIMAAVGLAGQWIFHREALAGTVFMAAGITAVFWALGSLHYRLRGREGLGIGDAKLLGAVTLCVGPLALWWVVLIAALGGIALALLARRRDPGAPSGIPFGPFLAYANFTVFSIQSAGA